MRIVLLLGLLHMALSQGRAAEILALLAPLVLAAPLARQIGGAEMSHAQVRRRRCAACCSPASLITLMAGTFAVACRASFRTARPWRALTLPPWPS